jgi:gliding motility-associated-like protein
MISTNGCISRDTVHVTLHPLPELNVKDTAICYGTTATPTASSPYPIVWFSDANYTDTIAKAASFETAILTSNTVFYVETVSANGCISRNTVKITMNPLPELITEDSKICIGSTVKLIATASGAVSFTYYSDAAYSDPIGTGNSFQTNALFNDTVFFIEAASDKNCKARNSVKFTTIVPPKVVAMDDYYLCYGDEVVLDVLQSDGAVSWNVEQLTVSPLSTQEYIVTANRPPCPDATDTVTITVGDSLYILPTELPIYKRNDDYSQQLKSNAESPRFTLIGNLPLGLYFNNGELSGQIVSGERYERLYTFTVQVEDIHGCKTKQEYTLEKELFVPKVFTPNGDGINDFFMRGYKVVIFDRLGIEIFRGDDGWDGTYKGKPAPHDIYFYKLSSNDEKIITGFIGLE